MIVPMKPTSIGIDFDGTVANIDAVRSAWIKENLGMHVPPWNTGSARGVPIIGAQNYGRMSKEIYSPEWTSRTPPIEGAIDGIKRLASNSNLYLVSTRGKGRGKGNIYAVWKWLEENDVYIDFRGFAEAPSGAKEERERICESYRLDAMVDDEESNLVGIGRTPLRRVLLKDGLCWKIDVPAGVQLARSWKDVGRLLDYTK